MNSAQSLSASNSSASADVETRSFGARRAIAIANYDFRSSGTVAKSIEIATAAAKAGLPVQLWAIRATGPLLVRVPAYIPIVEVGSVAWSARKRSLDLALSINALAKALKKHRPALFLSGGNHFHLAAKLAIALSGQRKRLSYGVRASNSSTRETQKADGCGSSQMRLGDRIKYLGADFVVAVSRELAAELCRSLPSVEVDLIPNGVDIERVQLLASEAFDHPFFAGEEKRGPVLVTMGRICRQKGFDILIRALARLPREMHARLLVIGEGSKSDIAELRALAAREQVSDSIDFLGYLSNPFMVLGKADLFVSSSRWEGASNALNEALVCGVPVVATDCPTGNREALKDGVYGTLVRTEDPDALAKGIIAELKRGRRPDIRQSAVRELDLYIGLGKWTTLLGAHYAAAVQRQ